MTLDAVDDARARQRSNDDSWQERRPPTFTGAVRFLWSQRVKLAGHAFVLLILGGVCGLWFWSSRQTRQVEGTLTLSFRGIERGEYPSGKRFDIAEFRAPAILRTALADAGIASSRLNVQQLSARLSIEPVIPAEVRARWRRQDRDGTRREEFVPTSFRITMPAEGLSSEEWLRVFDAVVERFKKHLKSEQRTELRLLGEPSVVGFSALESDYDYWDVPYLLEKDVELLEDYIEQWAEDSEGFKDPTGGFGFADLQKDLSNWRTIRLEALKAMVVAGPLVRDRGAALATARYRLEDIGIEIRHKSEETAEAMRLLEVAQKPLSVQATRMSAREGAAVVDTSVMDRVMRSDYIAPVVRRISDLQAATKRLEVRQARLERDAAALANGRDMAPDQLPPGFPELESRVSGELRGIVGRFNDLLEEYLESSTTSFVMVEHGPGVVSEGPAMALVAAGVLAFAVGLALFLVVLEASVARALGAARGVTREAGELRRG